MNCEELQLTLLATPSAQCSVLTTHLAACASCRQFVRELRRFERRIERIVCTTHVPEGLSARVAYSTQSRH